MLQDFNDVFSLRKPRDIKAGLSSGLKSAGKGIMAGAVGVVAAPVYYGYTEGGWGCAKGAAVGTHAVQGAAGWPEVCLEKKSSYSGGQQEVFRSHIRLARCACLPGHAHSWQCACIPLHEPEPATNESLKQWADTAGCNPLVPW